MNYNQRYKIEKFIISIEKMIDESEQIKETLEKQYKSLSEPGRLTEAGEKLSEEVSKLDTGIFYLGKSKDAFQIASSELC
jgi:cell division protein FtsL